MWGSVFIQKLQNKPDRERKRITIYISTVLIITVIAIWTIELKRTLQDRASAPEIQAKERGLSQKNAPSPLRTLFTTTKTSAQILYNETQKQVGAAQQEIRDFIKAVKENEQQLSL